jgi:HlyD family secretion protein
MDIAREGIAESRRRRRLVVGALAGGVLAALVVFALRLTPAAPSVERGTVFMDTVRRGEMLLSVRGPGTLVPVEVRRVAAGSSGRVAAVHALPGVRVEPDTVILTLENPNLAQELTGAELELVAAEANLDDRRVQLRRQVLNQRSLLASVEAEARQAALDAEADAEIYAEGIIGRIALEDSQSAAAELRTRAQHEAERLQLAEQVAAAELTAEEARVARLRAVFDLKRELVSRLEVRAGIAGVLQEVSAEAGQQVAAGDNLARVAEPDRLKAELRIAEVQAKDIEVGQAARVDTRNGIVPGRVTRVEPAVRDGAVTVDVALTDELPRGARSELSVDGLVEIERLDDVLHVGRPAFGQEGDEVDLFRLSGGGDHAVRVRVLLGKASVNTVEIREGLAEGDTVILSDTSAWEGHGRIRLR